MSVPNIVKVETLGEFIGQALNAIGFMRQEEQDDRARIAYYPNEQKSNHFMTFRLLNGAGKPLTEWHVSFAVASNRPAWGIDDSKLVDALAEFLPLARTREVLAEWLSGSLTLPRALSKVRSLSGLDVRTKNSVREGIVQQEATSFGECIDYQPGNGTRYVLLLVQAEHLDPMARESYGLGRGDGGGTIVTWLNKDKKPSMGIPSDIGYLSPDFVRQHLGGGTSDAIVVAELLCEVLGCEGSEDEEGDDAPTEGAALPV